MVESLERIRTEFPAFLPNSIARWLDEARRTHANLAASLSPQTDERRFYPMFETCAMSRGAARVLAVLRSGNAEAVEAMTKTLLQGV